MTDYWSSLGIDTGAEWEAGRPAIETHALFVSPLTARRWLEYNGYKHQRKLRPYHVARLARALREDTFEPSEISFYDYGEGPKCVNGRHRLSAIDQADKGAWLIVTVHSGVTEGHTRNAYRRYDVGLGRSLTEILRSAEIAEELGLTAMVADRLNSAANLIYFRFNEHDRRGARSYRDYEEALSRIRFWAHEGREFARAVTMSRGGLKRQLSTRALTAVALVTYRHQPDRAPLFWQDVATNSGLRRGDPAHTLVTFLADATHEHHAINYVMRAAAGAWNAFFEERRMQQIKVGNADLPIRIAGTPFAEGSNRPVLVDYPLAPLEAAPELVPA